jgi:dihydrofolate synthase / folylpolyglutamate synthase
VTDPILERVMRLHPRSIDLGLERIDRLLKALGSPHLGLPPVVHVAGTNGKGSLVAYLRAIAEAAGYRVHVYTSPHLVRFNERIRVAGRLIDDATLDAILTECETANDGKPITFFEITTVAAYLAFSRVPADLTLIEVGMGGRYDATNVIDRPALTAITPVGYDHTGFLGDKLEGIAGEKAGILKRTVPAVIGRQRETSAEVIAAEAGTLDAPLFRMGREWQVTPTDSGFRYQSDLVTLDLPAPALAGPHQLDNAATAVACIERLRATGFTIDDSAIARGLRSVEWPARLQQLKRGPLVEALPPGSELWLDGGHNPDGGRAIAAVLADLEERVPRPLVLIVGMMATKDCEGFLRNFTGLARRMIAVPVPNADKGMSAEAIADAARAIGLPATSRDNLSEALEAARKLDLEPPPRILITGSLYLAGDVLRENGTLPQ